MMMHGGWLCSLVLGLLNVLFEIKTMSILSILEQATLYSNIYLKVLSVLFYFGIWDPFVNAAWLYFCILIKLHWPKKLEKDILDKWKREAFESLADFGIKLFKWHQSLQDQKKVQMLSVARFVHRLFL